MAEQVIGYFFAGVLLIWAIVSSYYLWFQPEQSKERLIEAYSKQQRKLSGSKFVIAMMEFGIGIWFFSAGVLGDGGIDYLWLYTMPETLAYQWSPPT